MPRCGCRKSFAATPSASAPRARADQIRVGVNTGEVVVRSIATGDGHVEYTPIGHTTNLASRMQTLADPGSIVITESTRKLVEGYFALKSLGATGSKASANRSTFTK